MTKQIIERKGGNFVKIETAADDNVEKTFEHKIYFEGKGYLSGCENCLISVKFYLSHTIL